MERQSQRIVAAAVVERIGPVTAHDLLAMPDDSWGVLRDRITDRRYGKDGLLATCMACGGEVYIRTARTRGVRRPLFAHYAGSNPNCPWYQGRNIKPEDARAAQYQGTENRVFTVSCASKLQNSSRWMNGTLGTRWLNISHRQKARMVASQTSMSSGKGSDHSPSSFRCRELSRRRSRLAASTTNARAYRCSGYCSESIRIRRFHRAFWT